jgi:hypothetical protein
MGCSSNEERRGCSYKSSRTALSPEVQPDRGSRSGVERLSGGTRSAWLVARPLNYPSHAGVSLLWIGLERGMGVQEACRQSAKSPLLPPLHPATDGASQRHSARPTGEDAWVSLHTSWRNRGLRETRPKAASTDARTLVITEERDAMVCRPSRVVGNEPQEEGVMAKVKCPCGRRLRANELAAGWTVRCPACGGPVTFPEPRKLGVARQASHTLRVHRVALTWGLPVPAR